MNVICYARVSQPYLQDAEDKVSIDQQLADMRGLCKRSGWQIIEEFVDNESYKATQNPSKGKIVNPSGERADRPQLLAMLEAVKTGDSDAVLCWRDDRLVRHPRVAVALEDALDIGDAQRNGKDKIEIRDATGSMIDRFTLSIKATIWREENKRRVERTRMGKVATLQQGRWPGHYHRYGYKTQKEERGRSIMVDEDEAQWVRKIHEWFDAGVGIEGIRRCLIAQDAPQKCKGNKHLWDHSSIYHVLHAEDYTGVATWRFGDGRTMSIKIPAIIGRELWERNQERIERNKILSTRNASDVYLLQGLAHCGDCGGAMGVLKKRYGHVGGVRRRYRWRLHSYFCRTADRYPEEEHPRPCSRYGPSLDRAVWRHLVDNGIKRPELIAAYVLDRQAELQAQGESADGEIAHARRRLEQITQERKSYQKQLAKGWMTEDEFVGHIAETDENLQYWESELARLKELRDNQDKVQAGLDYVNRLMASIEKVLPMADIPRDELKKLPEDKRNEILTIRRDIVRALVEKVEVWANGQVMVHGLLDGSEAAQFELASLTNAPTWGTLGRKQDAENRRKDERSPSRVDDGLRRAGAVAGPSHQGQVGGCGHPRAVGIREHRASHRHYGGRAGKSTHLGAKPVRQPGAGVDRRVNSCRPVFER